MPSGLQSSPVRWPCWTSTGAAIWSCISIELQDLLSGQPGQPGQPGQHRAVVLTFDDAWADNHTHALGPLTRHRLPAILYVSQPPARGTPAT